MKKKSAKEKPLYTTRQNVVYTISNMWKWDKMLVFLSIAQAPLKVLLTLSGLYIVRLVISMIENNSDALIFIIQISIFSIIILALNIISNIIFQKTVWKRAFIHFEYTKLIMDKNMDADYENIENPKGMDKMQKAVQIANSANSAMQNIITVMVDICGSIMSILSLFAIITVLNPLLLLVITLLTLIQYFINNAGHHWQYKNAGKWAAFDRKLNHINNVSGDFDRAKDIRLYRLKAWLMDVFSEELNKRREWYKKSEKASFCYYDVNQAIIQLILCNGITFIYLISNVSGGVISIADAVFYLSAIGALSGVIMDVIYNFSQLNAASLSIFVFLWWQMRCSLLSSMRSALLKPIKHWTALSHITEG